MKISGPGNYVFDVLKNNLNKTSSANKSRKKASGKKNIKPANTFSPWESQVCDRLKKSRIEFDIKSRQFPLHNDGDIKNTYVPDFIIKNHTLHKKQIIIEAHEDLTDEDVIRYGQFMKKYMYSHHLIMIVQDGQLRTWNTVNVERHPLFHDIWIIDDLDDFIKYLKQHFDENVLTTLPDVSTCPKCNKKAKGQEKIENLFGYRTMKNGITIVQSYCRSCRNTKKIKPNPKLRLHTRNCIECKDQFTTNVSSQAHCNTCIQKFKS